jgi:hypothetical protein
MPLNFPERRGSWSGQRFPGPLFIAVGAGFLAVLRAYGHSRTETLVANPWKEFLATL